MKRTVMVRLQDRSYPVVIGASLAGLGQAVARITPCRRAILITNPAVRARYARPVVASLSRCGISVTVAPIPDGERYKTLETVRRLYAAAVKAGVDRKTCVVALGGGVVGDVAGFFAATCLRGLPLVQVPTTLLAMVDSSVGGKTGVDLPEGKNLVGAFHQPRLVWADLATLGTLPARQVRNGLAEAIKYGIISDAELFGAFEKNAAGLVAARPAAFERLVAGCVANKAHVVARDERETTGVRETLNFGHTFGHAIETLTGYRRLLHGEAVAIGMNAAARLAVRKGMMKASEQARIERLLTVVGLPVALPAQLAAKDIIAAMRRDKKTHEGRLRLVLPTRIGAVATIVVAAADPALKEVLA